MDNSDERARNAFPTAKTKKKEEYRKQLLVAEKQSEKYELEIEDLTKEIRSIELKKLSHE